MKYHIPLLNKNGTYGCCEKISKSEVKSNCKLWQGNLTTQFKSYLFKSDPCDLDRLSVWKCELSKATNDEDCFNVLDYSPFIFMCFVIDRSLFSHKGKFVSTDFYVKLLCHTITQNIDKTIDNHRDRVHKRTKQRLT